MACFAHLILLWLALTRSLTHSFVLWWQKNHPSKVRSGEFGINRPMSPVSSLSPWESLASLLHPASRGRTQLSSMRDIIAPLNYFSLLIIKIISHVPIRPLPLITLVLILFFHHSHSLMKLLLVSFFFFFFLHMNILKQGFWNKDEERNFGSYVPMASHLFLHLTRFSRLLKVTDNSVRGSDWPTPPIVLAWKLQVQDTPIKCCWTCALSSVKPLEVNSLNLNVSCN